MNFWTYFIFIGVMTINWLAPSANNYANSTFSSLSIIPKQLIILPELFAIIYALFLIFLDKTKQFVPFLIIVFPLILLQSFNSLLNNATITNIFVGIRNYIGFIPPFIIGYYYAVEKKDIKQFLKIMLIILLCQLPVVIIQYFYALKLIGIYPGTVFDFVSGTLGGLSSNVLTALLFSSISVLFAYFINYKEKKYLIYIFIVFIPTFLSSSLGAVIYLIILSLYYTFINSNIIVIMRNLILFICFLLFFFYGFNSLINYSGKTIDLSFIIKYEANTSFNKRMSRTQSLQNSFEQIAKSPLALLLGYGIGNASNNSFDNVDGKFYDFFTIRHYYDKLITELGLTGLFFYFFFLLKLFIRNKRLYNFTSNKLLKTLALGFGGVILILLFGNLHVDLFARVQFVFPFSFIAGYITSLGSIKNKHIICS